MDGQAQKRQAGKEKTSSPWGQKIGMGIWLENKTKQKNTCEINGKSDGWTKSG